MCGEVCGLPLFEFTTIAFFLFRVSIELQIWNICCLLQVHRLRMLGDHHHSTRIAFVEFVMVNFHFPFILVPRFTNSDPLSCLFVLTGVLSCSPG